MHAVRVGSGPTDRPTADRRPTGQTGGVGPSVGPSVGVFFRRTDRPTDLSDGPTDFCCGSVGPSVGFFFRRTDRRIVLSVCRLVNFSNLASDGPNGRMLLSIRRPVSSLNPPASLPSGFSGDPGGTGWFTGQLRGYSDPQSPPTADDVRADAEWSQLIFAHSAEAQASIVRDLSRTRPPNPGA